MRTYPALDITWPPTSDAADDEQAGLVMAAIDEEGPTAAEPITQGLRVFFTTTEARGRAALKVAGLSVTCSAINVPDDDWAERSQDGLDPVVVGDLMVAPPEANAGFFPGPVIRIRPSMGFGTGHHASTRLMLDLLQRLELTGRSVLDVGTGSGVLALAARVLGAGRIVAIDVDPDALASARTNCELNKALQITLIEADVAGAPGSLGRTFDVVLANLTGAMLVRYTGELARLGAPGGRLVVSGFQDDDGPAVEAAFQSAGLSKLDRADEDGWIAGAWAYRER